MECPRCGGRLVRYRLGERETVGCQSCEYVGVSVDHTAEHGRPESWDDAIDRFQRQGQSVTTVTREDLPADVPAADATADGELLVREVEDDRVLQIFDDVARDAEDDRVRPVFEDVERGARDDRVVPVFDDAPEAKRVPAHDDS